jgi:2-oxoisovalerate dehydrogenase E2 component (dihydrolipoyl transacylase)
LESVQDNRVLKEDVLKFLEDGPTAPTAAPQQPGAPTAPPAPAAAPAPAPVRRAVPLDADQVVPIKGLQRTMVKTMVAAAAVPVFGYSDECDVTALVQTRKDLKAVAEARGVKLSYVVAAFVCPLIALSGVAAATHIYLFISSCALWLTL